MAAPVEVYAIECRRCDVATRVPGWEEACDTAHEHAERCGQIRIRRVWLRGCGAASGGAR